jgi:hypothetical protein
MYTQKMSSQGSIHPVQQPRHHLIISYHTCTMSAHLASAWIRSHAHVVVYVGEDLNRRNAVEDQEPQKHDANRTKQRECLIQAFAAQASGWIVVAQGWRVHATPCFTGVCVR